MVLLGRRENYRKKVREKDFRFFSENKKPMHLPFPFLVLRSLSIKEAKVVNIFCTYGFCHFSSVVKQFLFGLMIMLSFVPSKHVLHELNVSLFLEV